MGSVFKDNKNRTIKKHRSNSRIVLSIDHNGNKDRQYYLSLYNEDEKLRLIRMEEPRVMD